MEVADPVGAGVGRRQPGRLGRRPDLRHPGQPGGLSHRCATSPPDPGDSGFVQLQVENGERERSNRDPLGRVPLPPGAPGHLETAPRLADIEAGRRRVSPGRPSPVIEDDQTPSASALPSSQAIIWSLLFSSHRDTIVASLDITVRHISGVPTYALTDNERTVSVDHVAEVAVRPPGDHSGWGGATA
jgi:hypothetical protein